MAKLVKHTEGCRNEPQTPKLCDIVKRESAGFNVKICNECLQVFENYGKVGEVKKEAVVKKTKAKKGKDKGPEFENNQPINTDIELIKDKLFTGKFQKFTHLVPNKSVSLILGDWPYGTTDADWDKLLDPKEVWAFYDRTLKDGGVVCLTADQPFLTDIINSNRANFRYCWYWKKNIVTGHQNGKRRPMKSIEAVAVFSENTQIINELEGIAVFYNQQPTFNYEVDPINKKKIKESGSELYGLTSYTGTDDTKAIAHKELLVFDCILIIDKETGLHSTQKPVALWEYLINVYCKPGDIVMDITAGSCGVGPACINTRTHYVLMEMLEKHANIGQKRLDAAHRAQVLFDKANEGDAKKLKLKKHDKHIGVRQEKLEFSEE